MPKWLRCRVEKGMFTDERTVTVQTSKGEAIAVFVPRDAADDRQGCVRVNAFERAGQTIAILPDEHKSVIDVRSADLGPA